MASAMPESRSLGRCTDTHVVGSRPSSRSVAMRLIRLTPRRWPGPSQVRLRYAAASTRWAGPGDEDLLGGYRTTGMTSRSAPWVTFPQSGQLSDHVVPPDGST